MPESVPGSVPEAKPSRIPQFIKPLWSAPSGIAAASTTRVGGVSLAPFASFNLGTHVGDDGEHVKANRRLLIEQLALPAAPLWLEQVHGSEALYVDSSTKATANNSAGENISAPVADAAWTDQPDVVLAVMTADCLPVLLASGCGTVVAAIHGGWRGLAAGILQKTVAALPVPAAELVAWMGPAIGPLNFEVGNEVRETFTSQNTDFSDCFTSSSDKNKCFADIFSLAQVCLNEAGVTKVSSDRQCTVSDENLFFSHRRDNGNSGRMASLIWRT